MFERRNNEFSFDQTEIEALWKNLDMQILIDCFQTRYFFQFVETILYMHFIKMVFRLYYP